MDLSNSAINKIGNIIREGESAVDYTSALKTLNVWRESHGELMDEYYDKCVRLAERIDKNNLIVAQRLKRMPTIIGKLNRFKGMRLSSMQDIAGVRIIVGDMEQLKEVDSHIKRWRHLFKIRDYISSPKDSGYRGKHFIFKKNGMFVEIQLRTQLQHLWATSVETTDIFRGAALKERDDRTCWHDFFCQVSSIFAIVERAKVVPEYRNFSIRELRKMLDDNMTENKIRPQIVSFALTDPVVNNNEKIKNAYYVVMVLNFKKKVATVLGYGEDEYRLAFGEYQRQEKKSPRTTLVVLAAVSQIKKIREAYPNYFMDLNNFLGIINFVLEKTKKNEYN